MPQRLLAAVVVVLAVHAVAASPTSLRRLQEETSSSVGTTVVPGNNSSAISYSADGTPAPQTTHHSTPLGGPIALGAIGILVVGVAAAVAHKKKAKKDASDS